MPKKQYKDPIDHSMIEKIEKQVNSRYSLLLQSINQSISKKLKSFIE